VLVLITMLDPTLFAGGPLPLANPTGVNGWTLINWGPIGYALFLGGLGLLAVAAASVLIRLKRATGDERAQLRWVAFAVAFSVLTNVAATLFAILLLPPQEFFPVTITTIVGFGIALPASFGVAMLRYRLYDLDLLLNRTIVYGTVTAVLAIAFGVADLLAQRAV